MKRIETLYAFLADNPEGEGIVAFMHKDTFLPMVTGDSNRADQFRKIAEEIGKQEGRKIRLALFAARVDIEEIT